MSQQLSYREIQILEQLAEGSTYKELADYFSMTQANVHVHCHHIRQKTGIKQTRDHAECWKAFRNLRESNPQRVADALKPPAPQPRIAPTDTQMEIFRLLVAGRTYAEIAIACHIRPQSVQNMASQGCRRLGILHQGWNRTEAIRKWLQAYDAQTEAAQREPVKPIEPTPSEDPMSDPAF